jgi:hypothetical protein
VWGGCGERFGRGGGVVLRREGAALRRAVFAAGGVVRAALGRGLGRQGERVRYHCMAEHSVYGEHQLRGAILDAWDNTGCVGQYWLRLAGSFPRLCGLFVLRAMPRGPWLGRSQGTAGPLSRNGWAALKEWLGRSQGMARPLSMNDPAARKDFSCTGA